MSVLKQKDLHNPFTTLTIKKISGFINLAKHEQTTAASGAAEVVAKLNPATQDYTIFDAYYMSKTVAGAGESMTIDLLVDGASILTGVLTFDINKAAKTQYVLPIDAAKTHINAGSVVTVTRVYVAGNAPTMTNNVVAIEPASNQV